MPGYPRPQNAAFGWLDALPPHCERNFYDSGGLSVSTGCGECPDPIPECQEGEALTVHRNTTELCCPLYQCGESCMWKDGGAVRDACPIRGGVWVQTGAGRYPI